MPSCNFSAFEQFAQRRRKDLQRIAWKTRGEYQLSDAENEAYLLAIDLTARNDGAIDFLNPEFQEHLLSCLYKRLVEFRETKIRNGVRLDHSANNDGSSQPLMDRLVADEQFNPESILLSAENESHADKQLATHPSLAAAYLRLLEHFNYRMGAVADHLLISVSYAYRCRARARRQETAQLHFCWVTTEELPLPRPWRHFKIRRTRSALQNFKAVAAR